MYNKHKCTHTCIYIYILLYEHMHILVSETCNNIFQICKAPKGAATKNTDNGSLPGGVPLRAVESHQLAFGCLCHPISSAHLGAKPPWHHEFRYTSRKGLHFAVLSNMFCILLENYRHRPIIHKYRMYIYIYYIIYHICDTTCAEQFLPNFPAHRPIQVSAL